MPNKASTIVSFTYGNIEQRSLRHPNSINVISFPGFAHGHWYRREDTEAFHARGNHSIYSVSQSTKFLKGRRLPPVEKMRKKGQGEEETKTGSSYTRIGYYVIEDIRRTYTTLSRYSMLLKVRKSGFGLVSRTGVTSTRNRVCTSGWVARSHSV